MRQCKCGGTLSQHELTGNREAWSCKQCGRYDAIRRPSAIESQGFDFDYRHDGAIDDPGSDPERYESIS